MAAPVEISDDLIGLARKATYVGPEYPLMPPDIAEAVIRAVAPALIREGMERAADIAKSKADEWDFAAENKPLAPVQDAAAKVIERAVRSAAKEV